MRTLSSVLCLSTLFLAGCNMVVSKEPWFTKADASGAPRLKEGVWRDVSCSRENITHCELIEVTGGGLRRPEPARPSKGDAQIRAQMPEMKASYLVVPGVPEIIQVEFRVRGKDPSEGHEIEETTIGYLGFAPTERDADGQVVAAEVWPIVCGPQPREGDANYGLTDEQGSVTNRPLPGLVMIDGDVSCSAKNRDALLQAARETRTMDGAPMKVHWIPRPPTLKEPPVSR